jgi:hypothetical protein
MILRLLVTFLVSAASGTVRAAPPESPPRLKRADSFLGMHFDFHADHTCTEIGKRTTPEMIDQIIDLVRPDYLQIDCKGHPGFSSYPTKAGNPAPGFAGDPLRIWREVTARRGVSLYMHYSGAWDMQAIRKNPSWGAINADGSINDKIVSFFGPYAEQLLIPQLRELAGEYRVDGAWIDGDCWAAVPDYSPAALAAFRGKTGIQDAPRKPGDPHWFQFLEFHREAFRKHLRHYIAEMNRTHPQFEICSNWAFTDHMAEPVSAPVDFLSGDLSPDNSVNSARLSARYLARQGLPWDLMAWSFSRHDEKRHKSVPQLQREAALIVALGGGFQAYFKQQNDASISPERVPAMAEIAAFCRARQSLCLRSTPVPQVALLLSTAGHYRKINGLFHRDLSRVSGTLQALLENQLPVEVLGEHMLHGRMAEYPLIVVPEWEYLEPAFRDELTAYTKQGGNLLIIGAKTAALFQPDLGVTLKGENASQLRHREKSSNIIGQSQAVEPGPDSQTLGELAGTPESAPMPAATIAPLGKGRIAAVWFSLGQSYPAGRCGVIRDFTRDLARELFPAPMVEVAGSSDVDVCLARKNGRLLVNLVNTSGPHQTEDILESIDPVGPLDVIIRHDGKPARITLEPGGRPLPFVYQDGKVRLNVPQIPIHEVIVLESK